MTSRRTASGLSTSFISVAQFAERRTPRLMSLQFVAVSFDVCICSSPSRLIRRTALDKCSCWHRNTTPPESAWLSGAQGRVFLVPRMSCSAQREKDLPLLDRPELSAEKMRAAFEQCTEQQVSELSGEFARRTPRRRNAFHGTCPGPSRSGGRSSTCPKKAQAGAAQVSANSSRTDAPP
jgi:hypothetical protein